MDVPGDGRAVVAPELDRIPIGRETGQGIPERVLEHVTPELSIGHDVETDLDLTPDHIAHREVLDGPELDPIALPFLGLHCSETFAVERVHRRP